MMDWNPFVSSLQSILDKESFSLEEILDDEEVIQETLVANKQLIAFLVQKDTLSKLLQYLLDEPLKTSSEKIRIKFPFIVNQIIGCKVYEIAKAIVESEELLNSLFNFLEKPKPLKPVYCGYFSRLVIFLLEKCTEKTFSYMNKNKMFDKLIENIENAPLCDILIFLTTNEEISKEQTQLLIQNNLLSKILEKLSGEFKFTINEESSRCLIETVKKSKQTDLLDELKKDEIIQKLIDQIFQENKTKYSIRNGINVLTTIIQSLNFSNLSLSDEKIPSSLELIISKLPSFLKFLDEQPETKKINFSGTSTVPFTEAKLRVVQFLRELTKIPVLQIQKTLSEHKIFATLLGLFFSYKWFNHLHNEVYEIIHTILSDDKFEYSQKTLIENHSLIDKILDEIGTEEKRKEKKNSIGYFEHLIHISNNIVSLSLKENFLSEFVKKLPQWTDFIDSYLVNINSIESKDIGIKISISEIKFTTFIDENQEGFAEKFKGTKTTEKKEFNPPKMITNLPEKKTEDLSTTAFSFQHGFDSDSDSDSDSDDNHQVFHPKIPSTQTQKPEEKPSQQTNFFDDNTFGDEKDAFGDFGNFQSFQPNLNESFQTNGYTPNQDSFNLNIDFQNKFEDDFNFDQSNDPKWDEK
ncbi:sit4 [Anaeramoeba ignava]|uniref:Sit4 n=1 Tax=Anaeramoeba ignava TaxID=1746090 RepID=A0A9Q0LUJ1_ANAIG|nr:sit4 [Anaeramoeba ignava]